MCSDQGAGLTAHRSPVYLLRRLPSFVCCPWRTTERSSIMRRCAMNVRPVHIRLSTARRLKAAALASLLIASCGPLLCAPTAQAKGVKRAAQANNKDAPHLRYQINFKLDFDRRTFTGTERVRWVNRDTHPASTVYFHLYANLRTSDAPRSNQPNASDEAQPSDEPEMMISAVRAGAGGAPLVYGFDDQATLLRVNLREP